MKKYLTLLTLVLFCNISYLSAQGFKWGRNGRCSTNCISEGGPVTTDSHGNVFGINQVGSLLFVPGLFTTFYGTHSVSDSLDLAQFVIYGMDSSGNFKWAIGTNGTTVHLDNIFTDDAGHIYVSGHKYNTPVSIAGLTLADSTDGFFILKIDSSGHGIWIKKLPVGAGFGGIRVTNTGDIYFSGLYTGGVISFGSSVLPAASASDILYGKYDSSGTPQWAQTYTGNGFEYSNFIAVSGNGMAFISGRSNSSSVVIGHDTLINPLGTGAQFYFVSRIDTNRNPVWSRVITPGSTSDIITGLATDNLGNLYCGGGYSNTISTGAVSLPVITGSHSGLFLFRFDSAGHAKWGKTISDTLFGSSLSVDADHCGNIWISGQGGRHATGTEDPMFLARFDSSGILGDTIILGSGGDDQNWVSLDNKGHLYVSGDYYHSPFALGDDTLDTLVSAEALFVGKYIYNLPGCVLDSIPYHHHQVNEVGRISDLQDITLYPNPATNSFVISTKSGFAPNTLANLFDLTGRLLYTNKLSGPVVEIATSDLAPGIYMVVISAPDAGSFAKKLVIMK